MAIQTGCWSNLGLSEWGLFHAAGSFIPALGQALGTLAPRYLPRTSLGLCYVPIWLPVALNPSELSASCLLMQS